MISTCARCASALVLVVSIASCVPSVYGPLAITAGPANSVAAALAGSGELVIEDACVFLDTTDGRRITLAFRQPQVEWNSSTREIRFEDPFEGTIVLASGASIEVGGASIDETSGADPPAERTWIAHPSSSCPPSIFEAHSIKPLR